MKTLIGIQDEYIETVNAAAARWSHRPHTAYEVAGGHANRTVRAARRKAERQLARLGFEPAQIAQTIKDAADMAALIRRAEDAEVDA